MSAEIISRYPVEPSRAELSPDALSRLSVAILQGDGLIREEAAKELAKSIVPWIRSVLARRGVRGADLDSLTVNTVTAVVLNLKYFRSRDESFKFKAWVQVITNNELVNWHRSGLPTEPLDYFLDRLVSAATTTEFSDQADPRTELQDILNAGLANLDVRAAQVLRLRFLNPQHSFAEIGLRLHITETHARVIAFRALRRLQQRLRSDPRLQRWMRNTLK